MTFTQIKTRIKNFCGLTSTDADTRIGIAINEHYRRVTGLLGLEPVRFVTRSASTTNGVSTVAFSEIEKIDRVIDTTDSSAIRPLTKASLDELRTSQPSDGQPTKWALNSTTSSSVTIRIDTVPQSTYSLQADGSTTLGDMSGSDEPLFSESFHDILSFLVIAEELLKKEKIQLAREFSTGDEERPGRAENAIKALRFALAEQATSEQLQQGNRPTTGSAGSSSGGTGNQGGTSYTQSGLLTFDRGAGIAPFAVAETDAPYVANLGAEFLGNITTDRLIGRDTAGTGESEQLTVGGGLEFTGSGGIQRSALTGDVTASAGSNATTIANLAVTNAKLAASAVTNAKVDAAAAIAYSKLNLALSIVDADVNASAAIAWTKLSKSGSSLADLATRSAADLSSGTIAEARLGSGTGSVNKVLRGNSTWGDPPGITTDGSSRIQQIAFAATQSASSDANTLDDYEEGTWTPTLAGTANGPITYNVQAGTYTKIGKLVVASFDITVNALNGVTGALTMSGLPFTVENTSGNKAVGACKSSGWTSTGGIVVEATLSATTATLYLATTGAAATGTDLAASAILRGTLSYRASS